MAGISRRNGTIPRNSLHHFFLQARAFLARALTFSGLLEVIQVYLILFLAVQHSAASLQVLNYLGFRRLEAIGFRMKLW